MTEITTSQAQNTPYSHSDTYLKHNKMNELSYINFMEQRIVTDAQRTGKRQIYIQNQLYFSNSAIQPIEWVNHGPRIHTRIYQDSTLIQKMLICFLAFNSFYVKPSILAIDHASICLDQKDPSFNKTSVWSTNSFIHHPQILPSNP